MELSQQPVVVICSLSYVSCVRRPHDRDDDIDCIDGYYNFNGGVGDVGVMLDKCNVRIIVVKTIIAMIAYIAFIAFIVIIAMYAMIEIDAIIAFVTFITMMTMIATNAMIAYVTYIAIIVLVAINTIDTIIAKNMLIASVVFIAMITINVHDYCNNIVHDHCNSYNICQCCIYFNDYIHCNHCKQQIKDTVGIYAHQK